MCICCMCVFAVRMHDLLLRQQVCICCMHDSGCMCVFPACMIATVAAYVHLPHATNISVAGAGQYCYAVDDIVS